MKKIKRKKLITHNSIGLTEQFAKQFESIFKVIKDLQINESTSWRVHGRKPKPWDKH